jgi:hypothetical protein
MGYSYLEKGEFVLRMNDGFITRIVVILCDTADMHSFAPPLTTIMHQWKINAIEAGPGLIDLKFDGLIFDAKTRSDFSALLVLTRERIGNDDLVLSGKWMEEKTQNSGLLFGTIDRIVLQSEFDKFSVFVVELLNGNS